MYKVKGAVINVVGEEGAIRCPTPANIGSTSRASCLRWRMANNPRRPTQGVGGAVAAAAAR